MEEWERLRQVLHQGLYAWQPVEQPEEILIYKETEEQLVRLAHMGEGGTRITVIRGKRGSGKKLLLKNVAWKMKKTLLMWELSFLHQLSTEAGAAVFALLEKELQEYDAYLCIKVKDEEDSQKMWEGIQSGIACYGISCYLLEEGELTAIFEEDCEWVEFVLEPPDMRQKKILWEHFLKKYEIHSTIQADALSNRYTLNGGEIRKVIATARLFAVGRGNGSFCEEDVVKAVRVHCKGNLGNYARRVCLSSTLNDMVMGETVRRGLLEICSQVRSRSLVGEQWGFYRKKSYGRGISVLFYGPPGTGKTMAAQGLASELGMELYRVDLSRMMSKYIGETQKNISSLFAEAKNVQAILFFDEADAFFSRRTDVKDSRDRGANGEIAHLLQEMEDYEGISILATNLKDNMDGAFKRRIKLMIPFEMPDGETRCRMWQQLLPEECPRAEDLNLRFFARHFELPGSEIQDILLGAAFQAADEGQRLGNRHIIQALKNSYLKYGRALAEEEFREMREGKTDDDKGSTI